MATTAPTYAEFIATFSNFSSLSEATVQAALDLAEALLSKEAWGTYFSYGVGLDAAHSLTMDSLVGTAIGGGFKAAVGPITSVSAAGVSTSFGTAQARDEYLSENWYNKTGFGQRFLRLQSIVITPGAMAC